MEIRDIYKFYQRSTGICTDTRKIVKDNLFIALKGDNFDGNKFAQQAIEQGALASLVDDPTFVDEGNHIYLVHDGLTVLQELANYHRRQLDIPIMGLTGSNGKTTTKELIATCLSQKYKVAYTQGNLNNHIGVPLTLLTISNDHDIAVIEMGANHLKEIALLCNIAEPDFGYITNFGKAHIEGFGNIAGVIQGKSELYNYLDQYDGTVFLNIDDPIQREKESSLKSITFGFDTQGQYNFERTSADGLASIRYEDVILKSNLSGVYNEINVAAAATIALHFGVQAKDIQKALSSYFPKINRSQEITQANYKILLDAYNANPTSMEAALINFANLDGQKTVILGDMFELGTTAKSEHQNIAELADKNPFDQIFLIGKNFYDVELHSNRIKKFKEKSDFIQFIKNQTIVADRILIKGSRGMALEEVLDHLN